MAFAKMRACMGVCIGAFHSTVGSTSDCRSRGYKFEFQLHHITSVEIDHKITSMAILSLLLIQKVQLLVTGLPRKAVNRLAGWLK